MERFPQKVLGTLELIADSEDTPMKWWLERILKEIYNVYPRLLEDFFKKNSFKPKRVQEIKFKKYEAKKA
jgi:hypothetical protein